MGCQSSERCWPYLPAPPPLGPPLPPPHRHIPSSSLLSPSESTEQGFIERRLEAARALPAEQRSPDVAAFVECCDLQTAARQLLDQRPARSLQARRRRADLVALMLTRSHYISVSAPLCYIHSVFEAAHERARELSGRGGEEDIDLSALLQPAANRSLSSLLTIAACLCRGMWPGQEGPLQTGMNDLVERLQQPDVRAALEQQLAELQADLPAPLLTYKQLLTLFVLFALKVGGYVMEVAASDGTYTEAYRAQR